MKKDVALFRHFPLYLSFLAVLSANAIAAPQGNQSATPELTHLPTQLQSAKKLGALAPSTPINVIMTLPLKDGAGAYDYAMHVSQPGDPLYGHYLTTGQFAARFGARQSDINAVKAYAQAHGMQIKSIGGAGSLITLNGPVGTFTKQLAVNFDRYQDQNGKTFFSADQQPQLPSELVGHVSGIVGLHDANRFAPLAIKAPTDPAARAAIAQDRAAHGLRAVLQDAGHGPNGGLSPQDIRKAYQIPNQLAPGKSQTLALFEQGGFLSSDIATYEKTFGLPNVPVKVRSVNGYGGAVNNPGIAGEAALDIDMAIGVNPQLRQIQVYEEGDDAYPTSLLAALGAMADDNTAQTVSISYGLDEGMLGTQALAAEGQVLTQMVAQGQGVYVSAGDSGAYGVLGVGLSGQDMGSQPLVTSVGGTTLFTRQDGSYMGEETWNLLGIGYGATGGGFSNYWPIPDYQMVPSSNGGTPGKINKVSIAVPNGGSSTLRNFPDVAAIASPSTGVAVYSELEGGWIIVGGTSVSAPIWASFMTIASQARQTVGLDQIGFANPFLYSNVNGNTSTINRDILDGSNGNASLFNGAAGFSAGIGYDNTTGLGSLASTSLLVSALVDGNDRSTTPPSEVRGINISTTKASGTLKWTTAANATGYLVVAQNYTTGEIASYGVTRGTQYTIQDLTPNTTYQFVVVSVNKGGSRVSEAAIAKTAKN
ncbi:fibronectin type III domain-containing protein [Xanthomonas albilineans]|uniref:Putative protease protein n=1 Tax=Xanthomonas albilineans (strain GPE PC73 / CFBP 7063) TaxID=380358 RepID=D2UGB2_XANAP|nr:protease pro-enzyme activation domain-containing protein [Xanthomonas albilineans]QHQ29672.1 putative protease protein [Xanthomonas albilineans]CBA17423.1 putative protease protein [Xanthomonas albilineans GPE PC73]